MKRFLEKAGAALLAAAVFCQGLAWEAGDALAAAGKTIGDAAEGLAGQMDSVKSLAMMVSLVLGIVLLIMGIIKLTKRSGGDEGGIGKGLVFIIAGVLMVGIPALVMMGNASIGFDTGTGQDKLNYNK